MPRKPRHRHHGDPERFEAVAGFIWERYGRDVRYIADVAGGQGMLSRVLRKRYNYECEVVDPRGWTLKGVPNRPTQLEPSEAGYYDLIVGLHPDEATRAVAEAASIRPTVLIPCCNFWSDDRLGQEELLAAIEEHYREQRIGFERLTLPFNGPKNLGLVSEPPAAGGTRP
jgi:hypothetical protein